MTSKKIPETTPEEIKAAGGKAIAIDADVSESSPAIDMFVKTRALYSRADILVNNVDIA